MDGRALRQLLALANDFKEGDLAIGGTADDRLRDEARRALRATGVGEIRRTAVVDDGVTDALERVRDRSLDAELDPLTVGRLSERLLAPGAYEVMFPGLAHTDEVLAEVDAAVTEAAAAVG